MTGTLAPTGDIVPGTGISPLDVENLTSADFTDFFFGAEERHRAAQTTCIQNSGNIQTFGCYFYVTHCVFSLKKMLLEKGLLYMKKRQFSL
jgi:hypothetical protein